MSLPVGLYFQNPLLSFGAAFVLHLLADTFLHWNIFPQHFRRFPYGLVALDVGGGLFAAYLLLGSDSLSLPVLAAIVGGNLPDAIHSLAEIAPRPFYRRWLWWLKSPMDWHDRIQIETTARGPGLFFQVLAISLTTLLLFSR